MVNTARPLGRELPPDAAAGAMPAGCVGLGMGRAALLLDDRWVARWRPMTGSSRPRIKNGGAGPRREEPRPLPAPPAPPAFPLGAPQGTGAGWGGEVLASS